VQAHILVCLLDYVMWKTLEQWQRRAGLEAPVDVVTPTADSQRQFRLRHVVRPDKAQALLLDRLGLELRERLRIPSKLRAV
jgi:hypothetical protein